MRIQSDENPASSCMRYLESRKKQYEQLLRTGDMTDRELIKLKGRPKEEESASIEEQTKEAWSRVLLGESAKEVASALGISANALVRRFFIRGWNVSEVKRNRLEAAYQRFKEGESLESIATSLETTTARVKRRFYEQFGHKFPIGRPKKQHGN